MLKLGKLYRHHMVKTHPGQAIRGCYVQRGGASNNGLAGWQGGINTIGDITENAGSMMLVEYYQDDPDRRITAFAVFLLGDRFVMLHPDLVEPV